MRSTNRETASPDFELMEEQAVGGELALLDGEPASDETSTTDNFGASWHWTQEISPVVVFDARSDDDDEEEDEDDFFDDEDEDEDDLDDDLEDDDFEDDDLDEDEDEDEEDEDDDF